MSPRRVSVAAALLASAVGCAWLVGTRAALERSTASGGPAAGREALAEEAPPPHEALRAVSADSRPASGELRHDGSGQRAAVDTVLELCRWSDGSALGGALVQVERGGDGAVVPLELRSDALGRVTFEGALGGRVRVRVPGYEWVEIDLDAPSTGPRVALPPSGGVFGRVVLEDGSPAARVEVSIERFELALSAGFDATGDVDQVWVREVLAPFDRAVTGADGRYSLPCPNAGQRETVRLVARGARRVDAVVDVALPRRAGALPDLVLRPTPTVDVHVVDEGGAPIAGARVWTRESALDPRLSATTDEAGHARLGVLALPATLALATPDHVVERASMDGRELAAACRLESIGGPVELVLRRSAPIRVRVIDATTARAVPRFAARVEFLAGDQLVGELLADADDGLARFRVPEHLSTPPRACDVARVHVVAEGFRDGAYLDVDPHSAPGERAFELRLEPDPRRVTLRGSVLREGEPVAGARVRVAAARPGDVPPTSFGEAWVDCDRQGRFELDLLPRDPDEQVSVCVASLEEAEFGRCGPLSIADAGANELRIDVTRGPALPLRVRGMIARGSYEITLTEVRPDGLRVDLGKRKVLVPTGAAERGELLHLPADATVEVALLARSSARSGPLRLAARELDARQLPAELVFDLPPAYADLAGRVLAGEPGDTSSLVVLLQRDDEREPELALRVAPDGSFRLPGLLCARYTFVVARRGALGEPARVLSRAAIDVDRDVDDLHLRADPDAR